MFTPLALFSGHKSSTTPANKGTILFVDDDKIILEMVGSRLKLEGFVVFTATRAEEALALLGKITADLVILDVTMPGLGGLGFLRRLEQCFRPPPCPVLIFSARHELESFFEGVNIAGFETKTCDPELFIRKVKDLVAAHHLKQAPAVASQAAPAQRWSLMLIDNDEEQRRHLHFYFHRNGFDVHARDGGGALVTTIAEVQPHVILMKYMLPEHNGPMLAKTLGSDPATHHIPVVIYDDSGLHAGSQHYENVRMMIGSAQDTLLLRTVLQIVNPTASQPGSA